MAFEIGFGIAQIRKRLGSLDTWGGKLMAKLQS